MNELEGKDIKTKIEIKTDEDGYSLRIYLHPIYSSTILNPVREYLTTKKDCDYLIAMFERNIEVLKTIKEKL